MEPNPEQLKAAGHNLQNKTVTDAKKPRNNTFPHRNVKCDKHVPKPRGKSPFVLHLLTWMMISLWYL